MHILSYGMLFNLVAVHVPILFLQGKVDSREITESNEVIEEKDGIFLRGNKKRPGIPSHHMVVHHNGSNSANTY
jgi:hypothetical protein